MSGPGAPPRPDMRLAEGVAVRPTDDVYHEDIVAALGRLERRNRRLSLAVVGLALAVGTLVVTGFAGDRALDRSLVRMAVLGADSVLTLRGVRIVDAAGRTRVRLGAPLPGPVVGGREHQRVAPISGLAVFDGDGDERGGFAVSDGPAERSEAFMALDSREGQVTLFLANPHDGGNIQVWDQRGNRVGLFAVQGAPYVLVRRGDSTIFEVPRFDSAGAARR